MGAPDVAVIGAGVFGLSVARSARRAGLSVRVLEADHVGTGASGGPVGALAPHAPGRWSALHAFQLAALASLSGRVAEIEDESGVGTGYARCGRVVPLASAGARARAEADAAAVPSRWGDAGRMALHDRVPAGAQGWLSPAAAPFGVVHDSLSARIEPRAYLAALARSLDDSIREGASVRRIDPHGPAVETADGRIAAGHVVIAAGWRAWELAAALAPGQGGRPVKGQAAVLEAAAPERPLIGGGGLWIVPHARGVAVGSTREERFADPAATDDRLEAVIARARALCPVLADAPVVGRWAGLRPKPPARVPVVGPLPGRSGISLATGGFGIGIGLAHAVGDAVVARITGREAPIPLPGCFLPGAQPGAG